MLEYITQFYSNYTLVFYILLVFVVIIEWPISVLWLSLIAPVLNISFFTILIFSFIWDFFWDLLHYATWRFFKTKLFQNKNYGFLEKVNSKLEKHSILNKLIVIKYTPPITSIWLLYLGFIKFDFTKFIKNDAVLCFISSIIISSIGYNFWYLFAWNQNNFEYMIIILFVSLIIIFFILKKIAYFIISKSLNDRK